MGTSHFGGEKLVTQTTVTVGRDGSAHAESFIETVPVNTVTIWFRRDSKSRFCLIENHPLKTGQKCPLFECFFFYKLTSKKSGLPRVVDPLCTVGI